MKDRDNMVEQAWLDDGDVVITDTMMKNFEKLITLAEWLGKTHPEILKEYHEQNG